MDFAGISLQHSREVASEMIRQLIEAVMRNYSCHKDYSMTAAAKEKIFQTLVLLSSSLERNLTVGSVFSFDSNHSDRKTPSGSPKNNSNRVRPNSFGI